MRSQSNSVAERRVSAVRIVGFGLATFVTGMVVAGRLPDREPAGGRGEAPPHAGARASSDTAAADRALPGPTAEAQGVPAGFARTEQGAVAAAASFATTGQALLDMDPLAAEEAVRQMAASATANAQVTDVLGKLANLRATLSTGNGPTVLRQSPISWRVDGFDPGRARVAVWTVGVLSRAGVAPPQAGWSISSFDLVWERDDWRIWSETVTPGPAPLLDDSAAPATSEQFAAGLRGFADFGRVQ